MSDQPTTAPVTVLRRVGRAGACGAAESERRQSAGAKTTQGPSAVAVEATDGQPQSQPVGPQAMPRWKRGLDFVCIASSLPAVLPIAGLVALLIKFASAGPVIHRQVRVGYRGKQFTCFKFRTMVVGASTQVHEAYCRQLMASSAPMTKLDDQDDRRIIPFGQLLRSTGLDELPQLWNVLRGEMSLVGPRPCLPAEYEAYLPEHRRRFDAVPGLTGLWQVSGKNSTTFARMIQLDLDYARNRCLAQDVKILAKTIPVVLEATVKMVRHRLHRALPKWLQLPAWDAAREAAPGPGGGPNCKR